jgi:hypothetical protein
MMNLVNIFKAATPDGKQRGVKAMTLPLDVSRCTGFDLDVEWCPERETCQRHLAWSQWDAEAGIPDYKGIPVTMAQRDCTDKIEVSEE